MAKWIIDYVHEVEITYQATVEAETKEEALQKLNDFDIIEEDELEYQGMRINVKDIYKEEE